MRRTILSLRWIFGPLIFTAYYAADLHLNIQIEFRYLKCYKSKEVT